MGSAEPREAGGKPGPAAGTQEGEAPMKVTLQVGLNVEDCLKV